MVPRNKFLDFDCKIRSNLPMRTQIFTYKEMLGIVSDKDAEGVISSPFDGKAMGFIVNAKSIDISRPAYNLLKKIYPGEEAFGDIDTFQTKNAVFFGWVGGAVKAINPMNAVGSNDFRPYLLEGVVKFVKNNPPKEFQAAVDDMVCMRR